MRTCSGPSASVVLHAHAYGPLHLHRWACDGGEACQHCKLLVPSCLAKRRAGCQCSWCHGLLPHRARCSRQGTGQARSHTGYVRDWIYIPDKSATAQLSGSGPHRLPASPSSYARMISCRLGSSLCSADLRARACTARCDGCWAGPTLPAAHSPGLGPGNDSRAGQESSVEACSTLAVCLRWRRQIIEH